MCARYAGAVCTVGTVQCHRHTNLPQASAHDVLLVAGRSPGFDPLLLAASVQSKHGLPLGTRSGLNEPRKRASWCECYWQTPSNETRARHRRANKVDVGSPVVTWPYARRKSGSCVCHLGSLFGPQVGAVSDHINRSRRQKRRGEEQRGNHHGAIRSLDSG